VLDDLAEETMGAGRDVISLSTAGRHS